MNQSVRLALQQLEQIRSSVQDGCDPNLPSEALNRIAEMAREHGWPNVAVNAIELINTAKSMQQVPEGNQESAADLAKARFLQVCYTLQIELAQLH